MCPSGFCPFLSMRKSYNIYAENYTWLWFLAASGLTQMFSPPPGWYLPAQTVSQSATFATCLWCRAPKGTKNKARAEVLLLRHLQGIGPVRTSTRDIHIMHKTCHRSLQSRSSRTSLRQICQVGLSLSYSGPIFYFPPSFLNAASHSQQISVKCHQYAHPRISDRYYPPELSTQVLSSFQNLSPTRVLSPSSGSFLSPLRPFSKIEKTIFFF